MSHIEKSKLDEAYWNFVEEVSHDVDQWPCWLKGGEEYCISGSDCLHSDRHPEGAPKGT